MTERTKSGDHVQTRMVGDGLSSANLRQALSTAKAGGPDTVTKGLTSATLAAALKPPTLGSPAPTPSSGGSASPKK